MGRIAFICSLVALIAGAAAGSPAAARVGPEIAYSTQTEVFLVNRDGSGKVRLYRSKSNNFISSVALKPGGGTIAFVEDWTLKFLDYNSAGQPVGTVRTILPSCYRLTDVHYHPDGNSVSYREVCGENGVVKRVTVPATSSDAPVPVTLLTQASFLDLGPWDPSGNSFVYSYYTDTQVEVRRHYIDGTPNPAEPIATASGSTQIRYPDVSNSGTKMLVSDTPLAAGCCPGPGYTSELDAFSGAVLRSNFITGRKARYSPDDSRIVFIFYKSYNERYLQYLDVDGQLKRIGGKGIYWSVDWGN